MSKKSIVECRSTLNPVWEHMRLPGIPTDAALFASFTKSCTVSPHLQIDLYEIPEYSNYL